MSITHRNRRPLQRSFDLFARHDIHLRYAVGTTRGKPSTTRNLNMRPLIHNGRTPRR